MPDKRLKAAALRYKTEKESAPRVVAKGSGLIAEKILSVARENKVPLKEDGQLVEVLSTLDLYQEIPPELYKAVAEILAFVYRMTNKVST
ncbi:MAG TPA: EscU/YscU/HrcU family type III secretion system export apparatus switch protein [Dissulfurispiraceae bacterium]|nr:EscU/YscU/HrcU family type III secretion system export apparatus switch protein [Dissulfurispiraceae bacterium]